MKSSFVITAALSLFSAVSFASGNQASRIEDCSVIAGRVATQMFIGNLLMRAEDVEVKVRSSKKNASGTTYKVKVTELANPEHVEIVPSHFVIKAQIDSLGLCEITSAIKLK